MSGRMKRVTDPLGDKVKARIVGRDRTEPRYQSSGSEHSGQIDHDFDSPSLSDLFFGFKVDDAGYLLPEANGSDSDCDPSISDSIDRILDLINPILQDRGDPFKNELMAHVSKALQVFSGLKSNKQVKRRNVMAYLRGYGYNVAICKTKWDSSGGFTSGNYEFIDVIRTGRYSTRYFIDLDFSSEFEIARPTSTFEALLQYLPTVFLGKREDLKPLLKVIADAVKRSLKSRGLHLPPWRKHRFMQNKWLGQYRRTTNLFPVSFSSPSQVNQNYAANCRAIGFEYSAVNGGGLMFPAVARSR